ncbi:hypothetical protein HDV05_004230 [Chytridiales sp. JEL 0842]|nr:hypothetical protein HDV05_004230 [Chytridiales sp. JEL 0842]
MGDQQGDVDLSSFLMRSLALSAAQYHEAAMGDQDIPIEHQGDWQPSSSESHGRPSSRRVRRSRTTSAASASSITFDVNGEIRVQQEPINEMTDIPQSSRHRQHRARQHSARQAAAEEEDDADEPDSTSTIINYNQLADALRHSSTSFTPGVAYSLPLRRQPLERMADTLLNSNGVLQVNVSRSSPFSGQNHQEDATVTDEMQGLEDMLMECLTTLEDTLVGTLNNESNEDVSWSYPPRPASRLGNSPGQENDDEDVVEVRGVGPFGETFDAVRLQRSRPLQTSASIVVDLSHVPRPPSTLQASTDEENNDLDNDPYGISLSPEERRLEELENELNGLIRRQISASFDRYVNNHVPILPLLPQSQRSATDNNDNDTPDEVTPARLDEFMRIVRGQNVPTDTILSDAVRNIRNDMSPMNPRTRSQRDLEDSFGLDLSPTFLTSAFSDQISSNSGSESVTYTRTAPSVLFPNAVNSRGLVPVSDVIVTGVLTADGVPLYRVDQSIRNAARRGMGGGRLYSDDSRRYGFDEDEEDEEDEEDDDEDDDDDDNDADQDEDQATRMRFRDFPIIPFGEFGMDPNFTTSRRDPRSAFVDEDGIVIDDDDDDDEEDDVTRFMANLEELEAEMERDIERGAQLNMRLSELSGWMSGPGRNEDAQSSGNVVVEEEDDEDDEEETWEALTRRYPRSAMMARQNQARRGRSSSESHLRPEMFGGATAEMPSESARTAGVPMDFIMRHNPLLMGEMFGDMADSDDLERTALPGSSRQIPTTNLEDVAFPREDRSFNDLPNLFSSSNSVLRETSNVPNSELFHGTTTDVPSTDAPLFQSAAELLRDLRRLEARLDAEREAIIAQREHERNLRGAMAPETLRFIDIARSYQQQWNPFDEMDYDQEDGDDDEEEDSEQSYGDSDSDSDGEVVPPVASISTSIPILYNGPMDQVALILQHSRNARVRHISYLDRSESSSGGLSGRNRRTAVRRLGRRSRTSTQTLEDWLLSRRPLDANGDAVLLPPPPAHRSLIHMDSANYMGGASRHVTSHSRIFSTSAHPSIPSYMLPRHRHPITNIQSSILPPPLPPRPAISSVAHITSTTACGFDVSDGGTDLLYRIFDANGDLRRDEQGALYKEVMEIVEVSASSSSSSSTLSSVGMSSQPTGSSLPTQSSSASNGSTPPMLNAEDKTDSSLVLGSGSGSAGNGEFKSAEVEIRIRPAVRREWQLEDGTGSLGR